MNTQLQPVGERSLSHFVSPFGIIVLPVSSVGTNNLSSVSNQSCFYRSQQFTFPPAICLLLVLLIFKHKGSPDNSHPESFMEVGLDRALQIFVAFLAHGGESHPSRHLYGTVKWKTSSYNRLKGSNGHSCWGIPRVRRCRSSWFVHEIPTVTFILKLRQGKKNSQTNKNHPLAINHSPLANFHALKMKRRGNKSWNYGLLSCEEIPPWHSQPAGPAISKEQMKLHRLLDSL